MEFFYNLADKIRNAVEVAGDRIKEAIDSVDDKINIPIYHNFKEAKEINQRAQYDFETARDRVNEVRELTEKTLETYGRTKLEIYDTSIRSFVSEYDRIKGVELSSIQASDSLSHQVLSSINIRETNFQIIDGVKALIAGGGAGAVSGAVTFGAVGLFASASTGTAISALSGAAATNATLAFLGGGSLAAGGGGVALGTAVLGGLVAIPVLLVGGFVLNAKAREALEIAKENRAQTERFVSETQAAISAMNVIRERCEQMKSVLIQLNSHLGKMTQGVKVISDEQIQSRPLKRAFHKCKKLLESALIKIGFSVPKWLKKPLKVDYAKFTQSQKNYLWIATSLAQTTKNILDTDLLTKEGTIASNSQNVLDNSRNFLQQLSY